MRWSLILSTFITVLSVLSYALPVDPSSSVELERRARVRATPKPAAKKTTARRTAASSSIKASSKTYRTAGVLHQDAYKFHGNGKVSRVPLAAGKRHAYGSKRVKVKGTDADHVFEGQMVKAHLQQHKLNYNQLPTSLKHKVHGIINGPKNVALVPKHINIGKGQVIKHAMNGKAIKPNPNRDEYIRHSYPTAKKTAKELDKAFKDHKINMGAKTFENTLKTTMGHAKIPKLRL